MPDDVTPEEKLLKLIKESPQFPIIEKPDNPLKESPALFSKAPSHQKIYSIKLIKGGTFFCSGIALILFFALSYQLLSGEPVLSLPREKLFETQSLRFPSIEPKASENFEEYSKIFSGRNLFKSIGEPPPLMTGPRAGTVSFNDLSKNLYLSGIIFGDRLQAVIEDRANGQIHYVESGDYIGELQVIEVGEDRVLLRYGEEEGQLNL
jgi:hypothetical protein